MYNMLEFTIRYSVVIDPMAAVHEYNLCKYELVSTEWKIAMELQDILMVSPPFLPFFTYSCYLV